jgi:hypothetical protein
MSAPGRNPWEPELLRLMCYSLLICRKSEKGPSESSCVFCWTLSRQFHNVHFFWYTILCWFYEIVISPRNALRILLAYFSPIKCTNILCGTMRTFSCVGLTPYWVMLSSAKFYFDILISVKMLSLFFRSCSGRFLRNVCTTCQLYGVTIQNTAIQISTTVKTSNWILLFK